MRPSMTLLAIAVMAGGAHAHVTLEARQATAGSCHKAVFRVGHGRTITEDLVQAKLPDQAGPIYWKVSQIWEQSRIDWAELPVAGQSLHDPKAPAALLEIVPATHAGHAH